MRWIWMLLTRRHETPRERALRRGRRALRGFKKDTVWLAKRPFSDMYGYDGIDAQSRRTGNDAVQPQRE